MDAFAFESFEEITTTAKWGYEFSEWYIDLALGFPIQSGWTIEHMLDEYSWCADPDWDGKAIIWNGSPIKVHALMNGREISVHYDPNGNPAAGGNGIQTQKVAMWAYAKNQATPLVASGVTTYGWVTDPANGHFINGQPLSEKHNLDTSDEKQLTLSDLILLMYEEGNPQFAGMTKEDLYTINEITLYNVWEYKDYTIHYVTDLENNTIVDKTGLRYESNIYGSIEVPSKEGYVFDGWYTTADGGTRINEDDKYYHFVSGDNVSELTLYAHWSKEPEAFAVYSADDNSLNFYKRSEVPTAGSQFEGKTVTAVYTGIEDTGASPAWDNISPNVAIVNFADEIKPNTTANWFAGTENLAIINNIEKLNTAQATSMAGMFASTGIAGLDLSALDTANVTDMSGMFAGTPNLASLNVDGWNVANLSRTDAMFNSVPKLTSLDLSSWNTTSLASADAMFYGCSNLKTLNLSGWNTKNLDTMAYMFAECTNLTTIYTSPDADWLNLNYENQMFQNCLSLVGGNGTAYSSDNVNGDYARVDGLGGQPGYFTDKSVQFAVYSADDNSLSFYKRSEVPTAGSQFEGKTATNVYVGIENTGTIPPWDTVKQEMLTIDIVDRVKPETIALWFSGCPNLISIDNIDHLNTANVTSMNVMFADCPKLSIINGIGTLNTKQVRTMNAMFRGCSSLESLVGIENWDVSNVEDMQSLFEGCASLTSLDMSGWNTVNVANLNGTFSNCQSLQTLNLSGWDVANTASLNYQYSGCTNLTTIYTSLDADWSSAASSTDMFDGCTSLVGGNSTVYDALQKDASYARVDGLNGQPGYFTAKAA